MRRRIPFAQVVLAPFVCLALVSPLVSAAAQGDRLERTLFVSVADRVNEPVDGLGIADFTVREDGVSREILRVSRASEPLDVAVLIDNATASGELVPRARQGLQRLIAMLTPTHSVALIALADRPTILVDYTTNAASLEAGIGRLFTQPRSGATLLDALVEVSGGLRRREAARAAIVAVVTDGTEYSNRGYRDVLEAITQSGAGFYPITVGRFLLANTNIDRDRSLILGAGPASSGGRQFSLLSPQAVDTTMANLGRLLTSQYKVVYSRPDTLLPPEKVEIRSTKPGLAVHGTADRTAGRNIR